MKLKSYKNSDAYFFIVGFLSKNGQDIISMDDYANKFDNNFESLKEAIKYISNNEYLTGFFYGKDIYDSKEPMFDICIRMAINNTKDKDESMKDNILYYCDTADFIFDSKFKLKDAIFATRNNIATFMLNMIDGSLVCLEPVRDITKYLEEDCTDPELAEFLLNKAKDITY